MTTRSHFWRIVTVPLWFKCMKYVSMNASIKWHPRSYYQYITQKHFTSQSAMKSLLCAFSMWLWVCENAFMHGYLPWPSVYWKHLKAEDGRNHQHCITVQSNLSQYQVPPIQLCFNKILIFLFIVHFMIQYAMKCS